jgi:hypothetical protein
MWKISWPHLGFPLVRTAKIMLATRTGWPHVGEWELDSAFKLNDTQGLDRGRLPQFRR